MKKFLLAMCLAVASVVPVRAEEPTWSDAYGLLCAATYKYDEMQQKKYLADSDFAEVAETIDEAEDISDDWPDGTIKNGFQLRFVNARAAMASAKAGTYGNYDYIVGKWGEYQYLQAASAISSQIGTPAQVMGFIQQAIDDFQGVIDHLNANAYRAANCQIDANDLKHDTEVQDNAFGNP